VITAVQKDAPGTAKRLRSRRDAAKSIGRKTSRINKLLRELAEIFK
jgi:hypothetical protein